MTASPSSQPAASRGDPLLKRAGLIWYLTAAAGQLAFVIFIIGHYGRKTFGGDYAGWNDKPIIKGYVDGDITGNIMFAAHVLIAAIMTVGGLMQLVPTIRQRLPALHRWTGRVFIVTAFILALGGLWLVWGRSTYLSIESAFPPSLNALLILVCGGMAWKLAMARRIDAHRRWAMRTFMVANGVWFLRVDMMAWVILTGGGWGLTQTMSSPVDLAIQFGSYLIPLGVLELYWRAQNGTSVLHKRLIAALILLLTAVMAVGIVAAAAFMWVPYI